MPEQTEPAFVRAFVPAPTPAPMPTAEATGPVAELHENFDLSRFGPNVQAAYRGPTADNPSASLKTRLRRAAAMDQMARRVAAEPVTARTAEAPAESFVERPAFTPQANGEFMLRRATTKPSMRPAYSK
jgi:hypothetical protein